MYLDLKTLRSYWTSLSIFGRYIGIRGLYINSKLRQFKLAAE